MTTLTKIPRNVKIQRMPYMGEGKKKASPYRPYAVHISQDGTLPKMGASFTDFDAACRKAARLSIEHTTACVMDQSRASGQRMVKLFRNGIDFLAN